MMVISRQEMVCFLLVSDCVVRIEGVNLETLKGRNVIVVEDIIDTGNTMKALIPMLQGCGVKSVVVHVLLFWVITRLAFCVRRILL